MKLHLLDATGVADGTVKVVGEKVVVGTDSGGGATNLDALTDVTITSPATKHSLFFNGTAWVNRAVAIGDVTNLQTTLDGKAATGHTHPVPEHSHALPAHTHPVGDLTATGTRDATTFLRGDNTWAVPEGGGGGGTGAPVLLLEMGATRPPSGTAAGTILTRKTSTGDGGVQGIEFLGWWAGDVIVPAAQVNRISAQVLISPPVKIQANRVSAQVVVLP